MKIMKYVLYILLISVLVTGCSVIDKEIKIESIANHKEIKEDLEYGNIKMEFELLDGEDIRSFVVKKNKSYKFDIEYIITEGTLTLEFRDSKNNKLEEIVITEEEYKSELEKLKKENPESGNTQIYTFGTTLNLKSSDNQMKIVLKGENAKGKINIEW
ncbi:hypothetical protein JYG23_08150 [Sedimentibacter sp. zth1]|uniref:hypothetical protein n=1 Tax=Sedimentibacter sp. zth1 TaxID=2816908 RepID=UPI001A923A41|nr:hypothetical protein [Sedimentibacter sp. zth1]QSX04680.1 hypothetical protein JYG23_08150 [Sedimentibacter sp. zth1]